MNFRSVLKYRSEIMAIATLWIVGGHCLSFCSDQWTFLNYFRPVLAYGYGGVEIFLFLSGIGIALSLSKSPTFMNFIFRRVSRILPAYWIILTFFYLLINGSFRDFFGDFLTLSYWYPLIIGLRGGNVTFWYVSAAFAFYLLSVPLFPILKKYPRTITSLILLIGISLFYLGIIWCQDTLGRIHLFLARIPIYFSGLYVGSKITDIRFKTFTICLVSLLAYLILGIGSMVLGGRVITSYGLNFVLLYFITPGWIIALASLFRWIEQRKIGTYLNSSLRYIGKHSLELYLTHIMLIDLMLRYNTKISFLFFFVASVATAVALKKLASYFLILIKLFSNAL